MTRFVLLLALLFGGSTDSSSSTSATVFFIVSHSLCAPLSTVTTVAFTSGCPRVYLLCFPVPLSLPFFPLTCLLFLPSSPYTASISIGVSLIDVGLPGCHDRVAAE